MSKLPAENFALINKGFSMLTAFDAIQSYSEDSLKVAVGHGNILLAAAEPGIDRLFEYKSEHEDLFDRIIMRLPLNTPTGMLFQMATNERIETREQIDADIKLFDNSFHKLNLSDQYHQIELLQNRQAYLIKTNMSKYQGPYIQREKEFTGHITKSMVQKVVELSSATKVNKEELDKIRATSQTILAKISKNTDQTKELHKDFLQFVDQAKTYTNKVMQELMINYKCIALTQDQIAKLEKHLAEFEYKYDKDQQVTQIVLYKILEAQEQKQKEEAQQKIAQQTERSLMGINDAFGAIGQLGKLTNNETIAKIGQLGQIGVSIVKNIGLLTGSFGFAAVGGLAMLGPISAIAMGGMALISLFGRRSPSEMQQLSKQLQAFQRSMERYLGRVIDNQQLIYNAVEELFRFVAHDLKVPIDYKLNAILYVMEKNQEENWICAFDREVQPLLESMKAIDSLKNYAESKRCNVFDKKEAFKLEGDLELWLDNGAKRPPFVGLNPKDIAEQTLVDIAEKINERSVHLLTSPLAYLANRCDAQFPRSIRLNNLMNIKIFSTALTGYNRLIAFKKELTENNTRTLDCARDSLANFNDFSAYLSQETPVHKYLITVYQKNFLEIHALFETQRNFYKSQKINLLHGTIDSLLPSNSENGVILRHKLRIMDACRTLLCAYCSFSGVSPDKHLNDAPYSSLEILQASTNWSFVYNNDFKLPPFIGAVPPLFQIVTAKREREDCSFVISHSANKLSITQYSNKENKWLERGQYSTKTIIHHGIHSSYLLFAERINQNGKDIIYAYYHDSGVHKMSYFQLDDNTWHHDVDTKNLPAMITSMNSMKMFRLTHDGQDSLYIVFSNPKGINLFVLDTQTKKFIQLADGPAWPNADAFPIRDQSKQDKIMVVFKDNNSLQFSQYDKKSGWTMSAAILDNVVAAALVPTRQKIQAYHGKSRLKKTIASVIQDSLATQHSSAIQHRSTQRCAVINHANTAHLCCLMLRENTMALMARNLATETWEEWYNSSKRIGGDPDWPLATTAATKLRVMTVCLSGQDYLLCGIQKKPAYELFLFDPLTKKWSAVSDKPQLGDACTEQFYLTTLNEDAQHQKLAIMAQTSKGLEYWQCQLKLPKNILQDKIHNSAIMNQIGLFNGSSAVAGQPLVASHAPGGPK